MQIHNVQTITADYFFSQLEHNNNNNNEQKPNNI